METTTFSDLERTALSRTNTLHGFTTFPVEHGFFLALAILPHEIIDAEADNIVSWIHTVRTQVGASSLCLRRNGYGYTAGILVNKDYSKRREILNCMLATLPARVPGLTLHTPLKPFYRRGETVSVEQSEDRVRRNVDMDRPDFAGTYINTLHTYSGRKELWATSQMQEIIHRLHVAVSPLECPPAYTLDDVEFGACLDPELDWPAVQVGRDMPDSLLDYFQGLRSGCASAIGPSTMVKTSVSVAVSALVVPVGEPEESCLVCLDKPPSVIFVPCCHLVVCRDCDADLAKVSGARTCIYCRQEIKKVLSL